ncbi:RmlC-like cupin [Thozetella sp. PMI_491]|nr:RmlC-like cupin [Thozetella sp. PMI_491]
MALAVGFATAGPWRSDILPNATSKAILRELVLSPSNLDRQEVLFPNISSPDASNVTFQFVNVSHFAPTAGEIVLSDVDTFPALIQTKMSSAIGFVDACGLNTPHWHPRATEFLTVVNGTLISALMLEDLNNSTGRTSPNVLSPNITIPMVTATLSNFTGMLYPEGLVHWQFNPTCSPAVFASSFDNNDSGRAQIASNFFSETPDNVILTALGNNLEIINANQLEAIRGIIPAGFAELVDSCAKMCNISTS